MPYAYTRQSIVGIPSMLAFSPAFQPHSVRYSAARTQLDDFAGRLYHSQKTEHNIVQLIIPLGV